MALKAAFDGIFAPFASILGAILGWFGGAGPRSMRAGLVALFAIPVGLYILIRATVWDMQSLVPTSLVSIGGLVALITYVVSMIGAMIVFFAFRHMRAVRRDTRAQILGEY